MGSDRAVAITAELISAYLKNGAVAADDLPQLAEHVPVLIRRIHDAFAKLSSPHEDELGAGEALAILEGLVPGIDAEPAADAVSEAPTPAVPIDQSITPDHVVCLECGLRFRSLRPHLISAHGLPPDAYRRKWALAADHPIVAPNYSRDRALVAKKIGLGKGGRGAPPGQARKSK